MAIASTYFSYSAEIPANGNGDTCEKHRYLLSTFEGEKEVIECYWSREIPVLPSFRPPHEMPIARA